MVGRLGPNLRPRQQIQNSRPGAPRSQAHRGARDVSRTDGPDRAEQSDEFIGLLAHEVAQTRRASRFWTFSIVKGTQRLVFRTVVYLGTIQGEWDGLVSGELTADVTKGIRRYAHVNHV